MIVFLKNLKAQIIKYLLLISAIGIFNQSTASIIQPYIGEINPYPATITQVETAIPAFIGYTEKAIVNNTDYHSDKTIQAIKINSLQEYELIFGRASSSKEIEMELNADNFIKNTSVRTYILYNSIRLFYANGGEECYIVSVGKYHPIEPQINKDDLLKGLNFLKRLEDPTLIIIPETVHLKSAESGEVHNAMLQQCNELQNRFAILDIVNGDKEINSSLNPIFEFRHHLGMNHLKNGAAYYPWLETTFNYSNTNPPITTIEVDKRGRRRIGLDKISISELTISIRNITKDIEKTNQLLALSSNSLRSKEEILNFNNSLSIDSKKVYNNYIEKQKPSNNSTITKKTQAKPSSFESKNQSIKRTLPIKSVELNTPISSPNSENFIEGFITVLELELQKKTNILQAVNTSNTQEVILPPSGAMAAIYVQTDKNRGVWKAPANVSINSVRKPSVPITSEQQEFLNIDKVAGKSINAIREFQGKGIMAWGARTLAGNDYEWRYISTQRYFNMIEASVREAIIQFSFEANDQNNWVKVRTMIENFLEEQWREGALAGSKAEHAFYVRVGFGSTMTELDILNGKMNIEIGLSLTRPAEFTILKITQEMSTH